MHSAIVHVVLAAYLAFWTPMSCCCAIKSALAAMSGKPAPCAQETAIKQALPPACPYCAAPMSTADDGFANQSHGDDDQTCTCRSRTIERQRLDTAGKIAIVKPALIAWSAPATFVDMTHENRYEPTALVAPIAHPPPVLASLLSQRSLLTI